MNIGIKNIFNASLKRFAPLIAATALISGTPMASNFNNKEQVLAKHTIPTECSFPQRIIHPMDGTIYLKNYHPDLINLKTNKITSQLPKLSQLSRKVH